MGGSRAGAGAPMEQQGLRQDGWDAGGNFEDSESPDPMGNAWAPCAARWRRRGAILGGLALVATLLGGTGSASGTAARLGATPSAISGTAGTKAGTAATASGAPAAGFSDLGNAISLVDDAKDVESRGPVEVPTKQKCTKTSYEGIKVNTSKLDCECNCKWASDRKTCTLFDKDCCWSCCCKIWRPRVDLLRGELARGAAVQDSVVSAIHLPKVPSKMSPYAGGCLCVFDLDRTLTGAQEQTRKCHRNKVIEGISDEAYDGGALTLSEVGQGIGDTFCKDCYLGIISAWGVSGSAKRKEVQKSVKGIGELPDPEEWSNADDIRSPLIAGCGDRRKAKCVQGVVNWYGARGIRTRPRNVYVFDDNKDAVLGLADYGFNFRQVSCASRDTRTANLTGYCGARVAEIEQLQGIHMCS